MGRKNKNKGSKSSKKAQEGETVKLMEGTSASPKHHNFDYSALFSDKFRKWISNHGKGDGYDGKTITRKFPELTEGIRNGTIDVNELVVHQRFYEELYIAARKELMIQKTYLAANLAVPQETRGDETMEITLLRKKFHRAMEEEFNRVSRSCDKKDIDKNLKLHHIVFNWVCWKHRDEITSLCYNQDPALFDRLTRDLSEKEYHIKTSPDCNDDEKLHKRRLALLQNAGECLSISSMALQDIILWQDTCHFSLCEEFKSEMAYALSQAQEFKGSGILQTCGHCGCSTSEPGKKALLCSGCKCATYCGKECQKVAWKYDGDHRTICFLLNEFTTQLQKNIAIVDAAFSDPISHLARYGYWPSKYDYVVLYNSFLYWLLFAGFQRRPFPSMTHFYEHLRCISNEEITGFGGLGGFRLTESTLDFIRSSDSKKFDHFCLAMAFGCFPSWTKWAVTFPSLILSDPSSKHSFFRQPGLFLHLYATNRFLPQKSKSAMKVDAQRLLQRHYKHFQSMLASQKKEAVQELCNDVKITRQLRKIILEASLSGDYHRFDRRCWRRHGKKCICNIAEFCGFDFRANVWHGGQRAICETASSFLQYFLENRTTVDSAFAGISMHKARFGLAPSPFDYFTAAICAALRLSWNTACMSNFYKNVRKIQEGKLWFDKALATGAPIALGFPAGIELRETHWETLTQLCALLSLSDLSSKDDPCKALQEMFGQCISTLAVDNPEVLYAMTPTGFLSIYLSAYSACDLEFAKAAGFKIAIDEAYKMREELTSMIMRDID